MPKSLSSAKSLSNLSFSKERALPIGGALFVHKKDIDFNRCPSKIRISPSTLKAY
ncbi:hypothetical protein FFRU_010290 [Fructobacillus fructosus]|nr:hypothetical protein FFRU_010290 [Fructobacillus fructosus]